MSYKNTEIIMYQSQDGVTKIDVRMEGETVWLTQTQMADLFQTSKQNISLHINNAFKEGEITPAATVKEYLTVQNEGGRSVSRSIAHYNLDVIISVGYRVRSIRGTQFRQWAMALLREYLIKGFTMNDELMKKAGSGNYREDLLERIRDIRSSTKVFYHQFLDLFATSMEYKPRTEDTRLFLGCSNSCIMRSIDRLRWKPPIFVRIQRELFIHVSLTMPYKTDIVFWRHESHGLRR